MTVENVDLLMILVAVATPALAALIAFLARWGPLRRSPGPTRLILLAAAGPANLAVWWGFDRFLDRVGSNSVWALGGAALAVLAASWLAGHWASARSGAQPAESDAPSPPDLPEIKER